MLTLVLVAAVACVAGFVAGLAGFGTGLVAAGLWLHFLPPRLIPPLVAICSVAGQVACLPAIRRELRWKALCPYLLGAAVGVPLGVFALQAASPHLFRMGIGGFLLAFVVVEVATSNLIRVGAWGGRRADTLVGAGGGLLGGLAGLSGPLLVVWLRLRGGASDHQRAIYQPFNLLVLGSALLAHWIDGHVDGPLIRVASVCVPATLLGALFGVRVYRVANQTTFRGVVLCLLALSGLTLIALH